MADARGSIFKEYYSDIPFRDRFAENSANAVDVIVPVVHTNDFWEANLKSFYREIPISRLLIGDGGCIDDSIEIAKRFPRVTVLDHRSYTSLGYSIRGLIEEVTADWFIYVHSDVYLPAGWFDAMATHQKSYDWFGCPMRHTVMVEYDLDYGPRPWAGSQMGRKSAFTPHLSRVEDDFVYRQEDFVFSDIVARGGFREGKVSDTFHYHQTMRKPTPWSRTVKAVRVEVEMSPEEELRMLTMQGKGIVKYLEPDGEWVITDAVNSVDLLIQKGATTWAEYERWVAQTNARWVPVLKSGLRKRLRRRKVRALLRALRRIVPS